MAALGTRCANQRCQGRAHVPLAMCIPCLAVLQDIELARQRLASLIPFDSDTGELMPQYALGLSGGPWQA